MRHLYVHVPFCRRRCSYCDFSIAVRKAVPGARFVERVKSEWSLRLADAQFQPEPLDTLYFGGGTPSLLSPHHISELIAWFRHEAGLANGAEVTLEANPDDVTDLAAGTWLAGGVTRISLGVQSLDDGVLDWMHRAHDVPGAARAMTIAGTGGFASWSVDLMFGLTQGMPGSPVADLAKVLEFEPPHLSAYGLAVEPSTPLAKWEAQGRVRTAGAGRYEEEFLALDQSLTALGFEHYEVSSYARIGHRSRHNQAYWRGVPYVGLGPSAHSFNGLARRWNIKNWAAYDRSLQQSADPMGDQEVLTPSQRALETVYLGLRTSDGVDRGRLGPEETVGMATAAGWLTASHRRLRATALGWLRLDELVARLTASWEGG